MFYSLSEPESTPHLPRYRDNEIAGIKGASMAIAIPNVQ